MSFSYGPKRYLRQAFRWSDTNVRRSMSDSAHAKGISGRLVRRKAQIHPVAPARFDQARQGCKISVECSVTADGACDTRRCHAELVDHTAEPVVPIRGNGRAWKPDCLSFDWRNKAVPRRLRASREPPGDHGLEGPALRRTPRAECQTPNRPAARSARPAKLPPRRRISDRGDGFRQKIADLTCNSRQFGVLDRLH